MDGPTRQEAAELIGLSAATITGQVWSGYLRPSSTGRSRRSIAADVRDAQAVAHAGEAVSRWRDNPIYAGHRRRMLRERAQLTQEQLTRRAGTVLEDISRLERGEKVPQGSTIGKLSIALNVAHVLFVDDTPLGLEMLTAKQVAQRLDVTEWRVREWLK